MDGKGGDLMEEEEKMAVVDIEVETYLHLSIDTWYVPDDAFIGKTIRESFKEIIRKNLEGHLIKVKSGKYENEAVGFIGKITKITSLGVRELGEVNLPERGEQLIKFFG